MFTYTLAADAGPSDLSCLSAEQKADFERRFQELMVNADNELKSPEFGERYIEIQNQKGAAILVLTNCNSTIDNEKPQEDACKKAENDLKTQLNVEEALNLQINSQSDKMLEKAIRVGEKSNNLRSQYPICQ